MKVAYFAESPADQAALTILTEAILGRKTETVTHTGLRHRGWPTVRTVLRAVLLELHYNTDAEGFALIVDANGSPPHLPSHEQSDARDPKCRLCQLRRIIHEVQQQVRPRQHQTPLKIALGLAVPAIEAWLLSGVDPHVTEAAWINGLREGRMPYTKTSLKNQLYGTSHPSLAVETEAMKVAVSRITANLPSVENSFPNGFGTLLKDLRGW
jgi:hypothetical protein